MSSEPSAPSPTPPPAEQPAVEPYTRKFSMLQRFWKLLVSPSEAMKDIALAPDYGGVAVIVALELVVSVIVLSVVFQKFQLVGSANLVAPIWSIITGLLTVAMLFAGILLFAFWLVKSWIVKAACGSGSGWSFQVAASVTGYAYIADLVFAIIGIAVTWLLLPQVVIDVSNIDAAREAMSRYAALNWSRLLLSLPFSFIRLAWKSYLGALGTRFGTKEKCGLGLAFAVFFLLGLVSVLTSFIRTY